MVVCKSARMEVRVKFIKQPETKEPILICGLPGSGYVGKLGVDHLIRELKAELVAEVYCYAFQPQVIIKRDGSANLPKHELYFSKNQDSGKDLIFYTGDFQPTSANAEYAVSEKILETVGQMGAKEVYTLAAYITGAFTEKPKVFGAATDVELIKRLEALGVVVTTEGTITGMNGLIIGLAKIRKMRGACLLGETSGYVVDAKASQAVLEVLAKMLGMRVDMTTLENTAKEAEGFVRSVEEMKKRATEKGAGAAREPGYIS